jgi:hypothetical protein
MPPARRKRDGWVCTSHWLTSMRLSTGNLTCQTGAVVKTPGASTHAATLHAGKTAGPTKWTEVDKTRQTAGLLEQCKVLWDSRIKSFEPYRTMLLNRVAETGRICPVHTEPLISKAAWDLLQKQIEGRKPVFHRVTACSNVAVGILIRHWKLRSHSARVVMCV